MKRLVLALLVATLSITTLSRRAYAQSGSDGSLPGGAMLNFNYLYLHECNSQKQAMPLSLPNSLWYYFNLAHCECSRLYTPISASGTNTTTVPPLPPPTGGFPVTNDANCSKSGSGGAGSNWFEGAYAYQILLQGQTTPIHAPLQIWVGESCDDPIMRPMLCHQVTSDSSDGISDIASIAITNGIYPQVSVFETMEPEPSNSMLGGPLKTACEERVVTTAEWAISNVGSDGTIGASPQYFVSQSISADALPPPAPTTFTANGADGAIQLSWQAPQGNVADIAYYQALCSTPTAGSNTGIPAFATPTSGPKYQTPFTLCGASEPITQCVGGDTQLCYTVGCVTNPQPTFAGSADAGAIALATVDAPPDAPPDAPTDAPLDAGQTCTATNAFTPAPGLQQLDPNYICGEIDDATATSMRIGGLVNGTQYEVMLVAIDKAGNPSPVIINAILTPEPVDDFWDDLHQRGSKVQGGFCLIADTFGNDNPLTNTLRGFRDDNLASSALGRALIAAYYGSLAKLGAVVRGHMALRIASGILLSPFIAIALLWHALTLPGLLGLVALLLLVRRLRRRLVIRNAIASQSLGRAFAVAVVGVIALAPARAHAQQQAYWDDERNPGAKDDSSNSLADEPKQVSWRLALGIGPYLPQIDQQFGMVPGPYEQMFGTQKSWIPTLTFERVVFRRLGGQWLAGITGAYLQTSAQAWAICNVNGMVIAGCDDTPGDPNRTRSPGDTNTFHLIPLALTASYRYTHLDDEYGVPIVPYARAGVSYYIWWLEDAGSGVSSFMGNSAAGASMGLQGTIGLSVRAERIDADAARSMRDSGLLHAGFFFEGTAAWVDGFGKATKLDVGDTTWFAGIDFEF